MLTRAPPVQDARDRRLDVDPVRGVRQAKRGNEALAGEHGIRWCNDHPGCGQVDDAVAHEREATLAHDLTFEVHRSAKGLSTVRLGPEAHEYSPRADGKGL